MPTGRPRSTYTRSGASASASTAAQSDATAAAGPPGPKAARQPRAALAPGEALAGYRGNDTKKAWQKPPSAACHAQCRYTGFALMGIPRKPRGA